eukprot:scaffold22275_cov40-Cyclotella_meneghiniana.AAC.1
MRHSHYGELSFTRHRIQNSASTPLDFVLNSYVDQESSGVLAENSEHSERWQKNFFQFISQECSGKIQLSASLTASRHTYLLPPLHSNR